MDPGDKNLSMATPKPRNREGVKDIACKQYLECLTYTARVNWKFFTCGDCPVYKPKKQRIIKPQKEDKDVKLCKLCGDRKTINPKNPYCPVCIGAMTKKTKRVKKKQTKKSFAKKPVSNIKQTLNKHQTNNSKESQGVKRGQLPQSQCLDKGNVIPVDFGGYEGVFEQVKRLAVEEVRPLGCQIIWLLKKAIDAGEGKNE